MLPLDVNEAPAMSFGDTTLPFTVRVLPRVAAPDTLRKLEHVTAPSRVHCPVTDTIELKRAAPDATLRPFEQVTAPTRVDSPLAINGPETETLELNAADLVAMVRLPEATTSLLDEVTAPTNVDGPDV